MVSFSDLTISKPLLDAISELGFIRPTPIQEQAYSVILSGRNVIGIAQTGTGKTLAYMLPILHTLRYSQPGQPRVLVIVPTRELVKQVVEQAEKYAKYLDIKILGVYGGSNINKQKLAVMEGTDILVATPGRLYDLALSGALKLKTVRQLVIDEVDVMLDLGFRYQLTNILELLPEKRQNMMFSATMTDDVARIIEDFFVAPVKITVSVSGSRLENINQTSYPVFNFLTKINLLSHLLRQREIYRKVLVFTPSKKIADKIHGLLSEEFDSELGIVHSNKTQNFRFKAIQQFEEGLIRVMITTDVMARGLDVDTITHVINFDTPDFPENYIHRIGRTGRAEQKGNSILFFTEKEQISKEKIEELMNYTIPVLDFPSEVEKNYEMTPEERSGDMIRKNARRNEKKRQVGAAFHEKKAKNRKTNLGGSYKRKLAEKYRKPKSKGKK